MFEPWVGGPRVAPGERREEASYVSILCVKIGKYIVFRVYRRSYLLWSPVVDQE